MGYLIIVGIIMLSFWAISFKEERNFDSAVMSSVVGGMLSSIPCLIVFVLVACLNQSEKVVVNEIKLAAMNDNIASQGTFYLGSGSVNSSIRYFYMIETDKGLKIDSIDGDNAYIVKDTSSPRIEQYGDEFKNKTVEKWFPCPSGTEYKIHIPQGSVKYGYKVDLK